MELDLPCRPRGRHRMALQGATLWPSQAKAQLQAIPEYQTFREELLENFYWKVSDYQIELSISHSDNKTEVYRYQFSLTQDEVSEFKKNIDVSMLCELSLLYYQPTNFTVFQKAFNPLEG